MFRTFIRSIALLPLAAASIAAAQWTVTNLHPSGADYYNSRAYAADRNTQSGVVDHLNANYPANIQRACTWTSTSESFLDMGFDDTATLESQSSIRSAAGGTRVGSWYVRFDATVDPLDPGHQVAMLWDGGSIIMLGAWTDMSSWANGASTVSQVGYYQTPVITNKHACMWTGSLASMIDLHPVGRNYSEANAATENNQGGHADGMAHLWSGTAASAINLHPSGTVASVIKAMHGNSQVGWVRLTTGATWCASMWEGPSHTWINLHPANTAYSEALGMDDENQVGYVDIDGTQPHAALWSGSASSWVDLHALLPAEFTTSMAFAISSDGARQYVAGYAHSSLRGRDEAIVWSRPLVYGSFAPNNLSIAPNPMAGGGIATATVTTNRPAPRGGAIFTISENTAYLACPATITVPEGGTSASFPVTTYKPPTTVVKWVNVSYGAVTVTAPVTLTPISMAAFSVSPTSLYGGASCFGTITLGAPAPPGFTVAVSDNSVAVGSPGNVPFGTGANTAICLLRTYPVTTSTTVTISAKKSTQTLTATLSIIPPVLNYLALSATIITGGTSFSATPQLLGQAFAGGTSVALSTSGPEVIPPATVLIPYLNTQKTVTVNTTAVALTVSRTISATFSGVTKTRTLSIRP